jgi:hypothetical protein
MAGGFRGFSPRSSAFSLLTCGEAEHHGVKQKMEQVRKGVGLLSQAPPPKLSYEPVSG